MADVVSRALKKDRNERYADAGEMHAHLKVIDCMPHRGLQRDFLN